MCRHRGARSRRSPGNRYVSPVVALPVLALLGIAAHAHKLDHPKRDLLLLQASEARVVVTLELDPGDPSVGAKAIFDRDSDGRLSPAEQDTLASFLARTAEEGVALSIAGERVPLSRTRVRPLGLDREVQDSAIVGVEVELVAALGALDSHRDLRFEDRTRDGKSHVLVEVRAADGLTLARPSQGVLAPDGRALTEVMVTAEVPLEVRLRGPSGGRWDGFLRWLGVR